MSMEIQTTSITGRRGLTKQLRETALGYLRAESGFTPAEKPPTRSGLVSQLEEQKPVDLNPEEAAAIKQLLDQLNTPFKIIVQEAPKTATIIVGLFAAFAHMPTSILIPIKAELEHLDSPSNLENFDEQKTILITLLQNLINTKNVQPSMIAAQLAQLIK